MLSDYETIVAGLGAVGSAALYQLARRGVKVLGIDRFHPPHHRGSSHGETRITRLALGEGNHYVQFVLRSHEIWQELESETGKELYGATGGLFFGSQEGRTETHGAEDFLGATIRVAEAHGIPHEVLDRAAMGERFPQFRYPEDAVGYFEPSAGFLRPEACVAAHVEAAKQRGANIHSGEQVVRWERDGQGVRLITDKEEYACAKLVLCAGPWMPGLLPELRTLARTYRQVQFWFKPDGPPELFRPDRMPVCIRIPDSTSGMFYGLPVVGEDEGGLKIAGEQFEHTCDPDRLEREVTEAEKQHMYELASPSLRISRDCVRSVACQYTVVPDYDFVIDRLPEADNIWIASACSGHGFKHSAGVGEALAGLVAEGTTPFDLWPFRLSRFQD